jgi:hypothetical protein
MPIPPDFDRFIEPMSDEEVEAAGPSALTMFDEMEDETPEVEELPDGSAIVRMEDDSKGPEGEPDFYENLADVLTSYDLSKLAHKYVELIEKDKEERDPPTYEQCQNKQITIGQEPIIC